MLCSTQIFARTNYTRKQFEHKRYCAVILQRFARGQVSRRRFQVCRRGIQSLQRIYRVNKYRHRTLSLTRMLSVYIAIKELEQRRMKALLSSERIRQCCAVKIQSVIRRFNSYKRYENTMHEVCVLNTCAERIEFLKFVRSSRIIQCLFRGYRVRRDFNEMQHAARQIQRVESSVP